MSIQRLLAIVLSFGGVGWGMFCLPFFFWNPSNALMLFGPGYVVTVGYIARACCTLSYGSRVGIWLLSALVQGAWLIWVLSSIAEGAWFRGNAFALAFVMFGWWVLAFASSVFSLFTEHGLESGEPGSAPNQ
jgi:hypothetical protein